MEIAERCKFDLPIGKPQMPIVPLPEGVTKTQHLRDKATEGARKIYGEITPAVQTRLDHELDVIARMGFEPIFLIVEDILNFAQQTGVPYSSRGSAASSLVAHCLGITSPDPLRLNLYFERFLNPPAPRLPISTLTYVLEDGIRLFNMSLKRMEPIELQWWEPSIAIALDQPWEMLPKHMDSNQPKYGSWQISCRMHSGHVSKSPMKVVIHLPHLQSFVPPIHRKLIRISSMTPKPS